MATGFDQCVDPIVQLIENPFWNLDAATQKAIIKKGRPCPEVVRLWPRKYNENSKYFRQSDYARVKWLAGSISLGKLFCWPCLLFFGEPYVWNKTGFSDMKQFAQGHIRHERTTVHIRSSIVLRLIEKKMADEQKDEHKPEIVPQPDKHDSEILERAIDVICTFFSKNFQMKFNQIPFSIYEELIIFLRKYDPVIDAHLATRKPNKILSIATMKKIIGAIADIMKDVIRNEIKSTSYVSVILNAYPQSSSRVLMATTLRYLSGGKVVERFLGFKCLGSDRTAASVHQEAYDLLKEVKAERKVIAYSFDGSVVPNCQMKPLQERVEIEGQIHILHCYAHDLTEILLVSLSEIPECDSFLKNMTALATFYEDPEIKGLYEDFMEDELKIQNREWNADFRSIPWVKEFRTVILRFLDWIPSQHERLDPLNLVKASGINECLKELTTVVMLEILSSMMTYTQFLSSLFKRREIPIKLCIREIAGLKQNLLKDIQTGFERLWEKSVDAMTGGLERPLKKRRFSEKIKLHMKGVHMGIVKRFCVQIDHRLANLDKLEFITMLSGKTYEQFKSCFPEIPYERLQKYYGLTFDMVRLKSELLVLYSHPECSGKESHTLIPFIQENEIQEEFREVSKLAQLILTLPIITPPIASAEEDLFSRLSSYSATLRPNEFCTNLASLAIEYELLLNLREQPDFYSKVICNFYRN